MVLPNSHWERANAEMPLCPKASEASVFWCNFLTSAGCPTLQFKPDSNSLESEQTPQVRGKVPNETAPPQMPATSGVPISARPTTDSGLTSPLRLNELLTSHAEPGEAPCLEITDLFRRVRGNGHRKRAIERCPGGCRVQDPLSHGPECTTLPSVCSASQWAFLFTTRRDSSAHRFLWPECNRVNCVAQGLLAARAMYGHRSAAGSATWPSSRDTVPTAAALKSWLVGKPCHVRNGHRNQEHCRWRFLRHQVLHQKWEQRHFSRLQWDQRVEATETQILVRLQER